MSRQIDLSKPLNERDRQYLFDRGRRHQVIENDLRFADRKAAPQSSADDQWTSEVKELTVDELKSELQNRGLSTSGTKPQLQARLIESGPEYDDEDEED
jgi:hypothetical protein